MAVTPTWQNVSAGNIGAGNSLITQGANTALSGLSSLGNVANNVGAGIINERQSPLTQELDILKANNDSQGIRDLVAGDTDGVLQDPASFLRDAASIDNSLNQKDLQEQRDYLSLQSETANIVNAGVQQETANDQIVHGAQTQAVQLKRNQLAAENPDLYAKVSNTNTPQQTITSNIERNAPTDLSRTKLRDSFNEGIAGKTFDFEGSKVGIDELPAWAIEQTLLQHQPDLGWFDIGRWDFNGSTMQKIVRDLEKNVKIYEKDVAKGKNFQEQFQELNRQEGALNLGLQRQREAARVKRTQELESGLAAFSANQR